MKRKFMLIALSLMLNIKVLSQSKGGMEEYYYLNNNGPAFTFVPIAYFQNNRNWYFEGRYNYEAANTLSVYAGKIFENDAELLWSVNPVAGIVLGKYRGGSAGVNVSAEYTGFSFSSQFQYTFSVKDKRENFFYSWSELGGNISENLEAGFSLQHTGAFNTKNEFDKGIFFKIKYQQMTFPLYIFNHDRNKTYCVISLIYEWGGEK